MARHLVCSLLLAFIVASPDLAAQQVTVDAGYATVRVPRTSTALAVLFAPSVRGSSGDITYFGSTSGALLLGRGIGGRATTGATWLQPLRGPTTLDVTVSGDALAYPDFDFTKSLTGQVRLIAGGERESAFLGTTLTRSWLGDTPRHGWRIEAGGAVARSNWSGSLFIARAEYLDIFSFPASTSGSGPLLTRTSFADIGGAFQVALPQAILLDITGGLRFDDPFGEDGIAASATVTLPIVPGRLLFIAGAGRQWADVVRGLPGGEFAYGSVRIAQLGRRRLPPPSLEAACVGPAPVIRARIRASTVEIESDLTEWQAVSLVPVGGDLFEAVLATKAATARVLWRIDGGSWTAPPGLPMTDSEFGERTAMVVLPGCTAATPTP